MILSEIDIKTNRVEAMQQYQMMASFIYMQQQHR
jgi:hypothetical protein